MLQQCSTNQNQNQILREENLKVLCRLTPIFSKPSRNITPSPKRQDGQSPLC